MLKVKKAFAILLTLTFALSLVAGLGITVNADTPPLENSIIPNPGFEAGTAGHLSSWHAVYEISDEEAHSGDQSLKVTTGLDEKTGVPVDAGWSSVSFSITPTEVKSFKFSVWYKLADDYPYVGGEYEQHSFFLTYNHQDDNWAASGILSSPKFVADGEWHQFTGEFTIPNTDAQGVPVSKITRFTLMDNGNAAGTLGGTFYLDDVVFEYNEVIPTPTPTPTPAGTNIFPNPGFEDEVIGFEGGYKTTRERSTKYAKEGNYSLKATTVGENGADPRWASIHHEVKGDDAKHEKFDYSFWYLTDEDHKYPNRNKIRVYFYYKDSAGVESNKMVQDADIKGDGIWYEVSGQVEFPFVPTQIKLALMDDMYGQTDQVGSVIYYDNIFLAAAVEDEPEPTPTPSEEPTPTPSEEPTPTPSEEPTPGPVVVRENASLGAGFEGTTPIGEIVIKFSGSGNVLISRDTDVKRTGDASFKMGIVGGSFRYSEVGIDRAKADWEEGAQYGWSSWIYSPDNDTRRVTHRFKWNSIEGANNVDFYQTDPSTVGGGLGWVNAAGTFVMPEGADIATFSSYHSHIIENVTNASVYFDDMYFYKLTEATQLASSTPANGAEVGEGVGSVDITFNYPIRPSTLTAQNVSVTGATIDSIEIEEGSHTATINFAAPVYTGELAVNLSSGVKDLFGRDLTPAQINFTVDAEEPEITRTVNFTVYGNGSVDGVTLTDGVGSTEIVASAGATFNFTADTEAILENIEVDGEIINFIAPSYVVAPFAEDNPPAVEIVLYFVDIDAGEGVTTAAESGSGMEYYGISGENPEDNFIQVLASTNVGSGYEYGVAYSLSADFSDEVLYRAYGRGSTGLFVVKLINGSNNIIATGQTYYARAYIKNLDSGDITYGDVVTITIN